MSENFIGRNRWNIMIDFSKPLISTKYADETDDARRRVYALAVAVMEANSIDF
jgi:hypothetical protein